MHSAFCQTKASKSWCTVRKGTVIALNICVFHSLGNWNWKDKGEKSCSVFFFVNLHVFMLSICICATCISTCMYIKCLYSACDASVGLSVSTSSLLISCSGWALVDLTVPRIQISPYSCVSLRHWGREETLSHHPSPYIHNIQLTLSFKFHQTRWRGSFVCW